MDKDLGISEVFLGLTPKTQSVKGKISKLDIINILNFLSMKDPVKRIKNELQTRGKYMQTTYPTKGCGKSMAVSYKNQAYQTFRTIQQLYSWIFPPEE